MTLFDYLNAMATGLGWLLIFAVLLAAAGWALGMFEIGLIEVVDRDEFEKRKERDHE